MKIAVFGTGSAGRTLAARLLELGHNVTIGTRDPDATRARGGDYGTWAAANWGVGLATFHDAAAQSDLILNVTAGDGTLPALAAAGADALAGKIVVDVSNPLDFSHGFPPTLFVKDTDSLGEQVQRAYPDAKVVKTLNTMNASIMANPQSLAGGDHTAFVAGNDDDAKATVIELLRSFGHTDIIDVGDITASRGLELVLPLWVRLMGQLGTAEFNFKIVR